MSENSHFTTLPLFEIEGQKYTFTRLGHKHVFMLLGLAKDLWSMGLGDFKMRVERFEDLSNVSGNFSSDTIFQMSLLFGLEYMKANLDEFLLSVLRKLDDKLSKSQVTLEELNNEDIFPACSLPQLIFEVIKHPDISMFVKAFSQGSDIPFFQKLKQTMEPQPNPNT